MSSKGRQGYVCPFCFSEVDLDKIHYACTNQMCTKNFLESYEGRRFASKYHPGEEIDIENSAFLGKDPREQDAVTTPNHIVRSSANGCCDICGRAAHIRLCPVCHNPIPDGAEEFGSSVFVVLGAEGVGKSHYIAVLIDQLRNSFTREFRANFSPATDRTALRYDDVYYRRLFEEGRKLPPTTSPEIDRDAREPMVYYLRFPGDRPQEYTLAFFDTAGSDIGSGAGRPELGPAVSRSSGIVLLIDPLRIPYVNKRIRMENKPDPDEDAGGGISYIDELVRAGRRLRKKDRIDIPLAVVLTKVDVLMKPPENDEEEKVLFGPESSINVPREKGRYDRLNLDEVSAEVEEYLRRALGDEFTGEVARFKQHEYFAVSALGSNPAGDMVSSGISPFRVEDPFIWLFNVCGGSRSMRQ